MDRFESPRPASSNCNCSEQHYESPRLARGRSGGYPRYARVGPPERLPSGATEPRPFIPPGQHCAGRPGATTRGPALPRRRDTRVAPGRAVTVARAVAPSWSSRAQRANGSKELALSVRDSAARGLRERSERRLERRAERVFRWTSERSERVGWGGRGCDREGMKGAAALGPVRRRKHRGPSAALTQRGAQRVATGRALGESEALASTRRVAP